MFEELEGKNPIAEYGDNLGAHTSIAGGLHNAFVHLWEIGGCALQIFSKSQRQWFAKKLSEEEIELFKKARQEYGLTLPIVVHSSYLINLASAKEEIRKKSKAALIEEIRRCHQLGIEYLNFHPGAHLGEGEAWGIKKIIKGLNVITSATEETEVIVLLENTAGQGSQLGYTIEQLKEMIEGVDDNYRHRVGICWDTCHGFAAGYEIRSKDAYEELMGKIDELIGLDRLYAFHLNDSKFPLGSRKDRHANIGEGEIGLAGFAHLVNDERFYDRPMVLETPTENDGYARDLRSLRSLKQDRENLARLRSLKDPG